MRYSILIFLFATTLKLAAEDGPVSFERNVLPLLEAKCNSCHHPNESSGGLDLTRFATMLRGGDELGPAIVAGKPDDSPLIDVIVGQEPAMPEGGPPLKQAEIDLLRRWVAQGADDDTPKFSAQAIDFFEREVRPVLFKYCFECHAGDEPESGLRLTSRHGILRGGERGPAVVVGKPDQSRLIRAVRHQGELRMPRGGDPLRAHQIASLEQWIRIGMPWPSDELVLTREKLFTITDADRRHWAFRSLPNLKPSDWSIDAVLSARHRESNLEPALLADRHRMLRRLTFDLIGYPPTPEEINAFVSDDSAVAYERVVDRLLNSPHYGWRFGRHWLDYTRNGANGQSNRGPVMAPDRYARWVADCFNEDRPYDWFAQVHLAGDRMPDFNGRQYSIDQALAAAVPLNGMRTFQRAETETFVLMDKLDEGIEFMGRSLMGISLECARCHDHKFDPIAQRDYYGLLGFFQSSWFGPVPDSATSRERADSAQARYRVLLRDHARLRGLVRRAGTEINVGGGGLVRKWQASRQAPLAPKEKRGVELEVQILRAELRQAEAASPTAEGELNDLRKTIASREKSLQGFKPRRFYAVAFKELGYELHGHKTQVGLIERASEVALPEVVAELETLDQFWKDERKRWDERQTFGGYRKTDPEVAQLALWHDGIAKIQAELDRLQARQIMVRCEGGLRRAEELEPFEQEAKEDKRAFYPELVPPYLGDSRLLKRGDVLEPGPMIPRGYPEFFGGGTPEVSGSGRMELAQWIVQPESIQSTLVARAAVNRLWQQLFGEGLCRTPKELGRLGHEPEIPELIDGLAARLIESGWSIKSVVREIVMSDAYRRSSEMNESAIELDPQNRLFARQFVRRLESEPIMNLIAYLRYGRRFADPVVRDAKLAGHEDFFKHFDGPTTDDLIDRRVASISASQALFMMNGSSSKVIAADLSNRLRRSAKNPELSDLLNPLYRTVFQRPPSKLESELSIDFLERRRQQTKEVNHVAEIREFIHLSLCGNELIYLE